jgi:hypothetical protein
VAPSVPRGPGLLSLYIDSLWAERFGDQIPPIPVTEQAKTKVCGRSLAGVAGSNPAGGMDVCVISKNRKKFRGVKTLKQVRLKHKSTREYKKQSGRGGGGADFSHLSRPALVSTQPPIRRVPDLFPGGKASWAWI